MRPDNVTQATATRVLVVDDDESICTMLVTYLTKHGCNVDHAGTSSAARALIAHTQYDILLLDQQLPDGDGLKIAQEVTSTDADCGVLLMTAYASVKSAVDALHSGLADYLVKPFASLEFVQASVARVADNLAIRRRNRALVEEIKKQKERLEALVVRDPLTNLFNHGFFQEALEREILRASRHDFPVSLLVINVDHFKSLNERLGHAVGDRLLQRLAEVVTGQSRASDVPFLLGQTDVAARYGGNEIAIILPQTDKRGAAAKAEMLRSHVAHASFAEVGANQVTISLGVASFPDDADSRALLVQSARAAIEMARRCGGNRVCSFLANSDEWSSLSHHDGHVAELLTALDDLISGRKFNFAFQPIHHAKGGGVYGYEALVRPSHPAINGPTHLFEVAERAGRVPELGRVVRSGAMNNIVALPFPYSLFVNLHPFELNDPHLLDIVPEVDEQRARIVFEITESSAIKDFDRVSTRISELRRRGYRIAVDDLGSGYAGLLALSQLTPDFVKLDCALVRRVNEDERTERLVRHLVDFANGEGITVVAEGIETDVERSTLEEMGCGLLQGYLLGRPAPTFAG